MAGVSDRERVSHVLRRLSMGVQPAALAKAHDVDEAKALAFDLSPPPPTPLAMQPPADPYEARNVAAIGGAIAWWLEQMRSGRRMIEERLVWFWHDHFATSIAKVRVPYLMYQQHLTIRRHATGSFRDLLHAMAKDPAMLVYLDGITNTARQRNENFGRECMELFTMGRTGGYTQADVVAASRAFSGWVVNLPRRKAGTGAGAADRLAALGVPFWHAAFIPFRHDDGEKTLLGTTGNLDLDQALDVILEHPATAPRIAGRLYQELVGVPADPATQGRLADAFRRDWQILPLVRAIVDAPAFTADAAVRAKVRTPIEKLVGILQLGPPGPVEPGRVAVRPNARARAGGLAPVGQALRTLGYVPFAPPNVGGFPKGPSLLGPHRLVHSFDLLGALAAPPDDSGDTDALFARFGLYDVSARSRRVVGNARDPGRRLALVVGSPEYALT